MIFSKTELGQAALQNRSIALSPRQRSAFIMFDGKRSTEDVLKATAGLGVTTDDVSHLVALGLLADSAAALPQPASSPAESIAAPAPQKDAQAQYSKAYPIAIRLTAALGLRGFRLNLAVEAAGDVARLRDLAPKIKEAVGAEKFKALESALYD
ncbi:hypothetical protein SAMN05216344_105149 [Polaromonas sp. OV174]|uniref:hypothetical protein n=1 Tax=Polaromonas sp. OV174 TaxID=1855300 RepID=UPI0008E9CC92|nr:hypothetical protein [Polaromonas sp. OV174]SFB91697.1 hypothetical protein SAMN05216344_105149 [Polaromonas sp. OV174]